MSFKPKFPRAAALAVAKELCVALAPVTERLIVAGSLRRRKLEVGDVEVLFIPKMITVPDGLFDSKMVSQADLVLLDLMSLNVIGQRKNVNGSVMWGAKNKLAVHVASGIPVDLFTATAENWFNYLVCRTGSAESNMAICNAAIAKGWKWNPYGAGFTDTHGNLVPVTIEREVFELVGLKYLEPWERNGPPAIGAAPANCPR